MTGWCTTKRTARGGMLAVASAGAILSWRAITEVAGAQGAVAPEVSWLMPVVVEGTWLTSCAVAMARAEDGERSRYALLVMSLVLGLSVVVNVAHAAHATLLGQVLAGAPPVALWLAVEGLLHELRRQARNASNGRQIAPLREVHVTGLAARTNGVHAPALLEGRPTTHQDDAGALSTVEQVRTLVREAEAQGVRLTSAQVAQQLGLSGGYVRRVLQQVRAA